MKKRYWSLGLALLLALSSCKSSQGVTSGGGGTSSGHASGGKGQEAVALLAEELQAFRPVPAQTDAYERFEQKAPLPAQSGSSGKPQGAPQSTRSVEGVLEGKLLLLRGARSSITKTPGYKILLYSGSDVAHANECVAKLKELATPVEGMPAPLFTEAAIHFNYEAPNYIVKVGNYLSRMKAYQAYISLKKDFPQAIVTSEPVEIQR